MNRKQFLVSWLLWATMRSSKPKCLNTLNFKFPCKDPPRNLRLNAAIYEYIGIWACIKRDEYQICKNKHMKICTRKMQGKGIIILEPALSYSTIGKKKKTWEHETLGLITDHHNKRPTCEVAENCKTSLLPNPRSMQMVVVVVVYNRHLSSSIIVITWKSQSQNKEVCDKTINHEQNKQSVFWSFPFFVFEQFQRKSLVTKSQTN